MKKNLFYINPQVTSIIISVQVGIFCLVSSTKSFAISANVYSFGIIKLWLLMTPIKKIGAYGGAGK